MGGQDHVVAAFQHPELVGQRLRSPAKIGLGDDVEDDLAGAATSTSCGPRGRTRRPMPRSSGQAPVTSPT
jgi:hypothetical protein